MTIPRYKWQPTTAEIAAAAGIDPSQVIRFDHNTTPWPTEWAVELATAAARTLNEYPGASYFSLRQAAARRHGLEPEQIVPGAGADELIILAARAFLGPGKTSLAMGPTYPLYNIACAQVGTDLRIIPSVPPDFAAPVATLVEAAPHADLVWLCVPNNPTAVEMGPDDVAAIVAATDGIVIVDAAYAEFTGDDWVDEVRRYDNLVVFRTMSKAFSLAGARVGYAMGHPSLIDRFDGLRPPGSIASLSAALAEVALTQVERAEQAVAALNAARVDLAPALAALGFRVLPSRVNFLLCEVGAHAKRTATALRSRGLVVRTFPDETGLGDYLRFTVRSADQNQRLLATLEEVLP